MVANLYVLQNTEGNKSFLGINNLITTRSLKNFAPDHFFLFGGGGGQIGHQVSNFYALRENENHATEPSVTEVC